MRRVPGRRIPTTRSCPSPSWSCRWSWSSAGSGRDGGVGSAPRRRQRFASSSVARRSPSSSWSRAWSLAWRRCWPPRWLRPRARPPRSTCLRRRPSSACSSSASSATACLAMGVVARAWRLTRSYLVSPGADPTPDLFDDVETLAIDLAHASSAPPPIQAPRRTLRDGRRTGWHDRCAPPVAGLHRHRHRLRRRPVDLAQPGRGRAVARRGDGHRAPLCRPGRPLVVAAYATVGRYLELIRHETA